GNGRRWLRFFVLENFANAEGPDQQPQDLGAVGGVAAVELDDGEFGLHAGGVESYSGSAAQGREAVFAAVATGVEDAEVLQAEGDEGEEKNGDDGDSDRSDERNESYWPIVFHVRSCQ